MELPTHISSGSRAGCQAHVQVIRPTCAVTGARVTTAATRSNFACNSDLAMSSVVIGWLQLQRFEKEVSESPRGIACDCGEGGECLGCIWGCVWGCVWGVSGVCLGSAWGVGGMEVLCVRRWEEV